MASHDNDGCGHIVAALACGFVLGATALCVLLIASGRTYNDGVINATRGLATARLVEKPNGTNEWKVTPKEPTP
jgi:hypothetical protein